MNYKLVKKYNPANRKESARWYATPVNNGKITAFQLKRQVMLHSNAGKDTVQKVSEAIVETVKELLQNGYSVSFGTLGTFRVSFSSVGVEREEDFKPEMIGNFKVIFTPSVEFQQALKEKITK